MRDLLLQSITIFFLVQDGQRRQRRRNLFVDEQILPPLKPIENTKVDGPSSRYSNRIPVLYTNDPEAVTEWIDQNICNRPMVVGWDTESSPNLPWRRNTKYIGPSTVQLSTVDATMVLEIANEIEGGHPDSLLPLKGILADASILKAGVGIDDDMLELHRWDDDVAEEVFGRFDIGGIGSSKGRSASLKTLAKVILGLELPKSKKIAMSNWAKAPLSKTQIQYAARDAWVAAAVMDELCRLDPSLFATMSVLESMRQYNDSNEQHDDFGSTFHAKKENQVEAF